MSQQFSRATKSAEPTPGPSNEPARPDVNEQECGKAQTKHHNLWNYYKRIPKTAEEVRNKTSRVQCLNCPQILVQSKGSTSTLHNHLKAIHKDLAASLYRTTLSTKRKNDCDAFELAEVMAESEQYEKERDETISLDPNTPLKPRYKKPKTETSQRYDAFNFILRNLIIISDLQRVKNNFFIFKSVCND